jgi:hypothetical protein
MTEINNHLQHNCNHSHEHIHSDPNENPAVFSTTVSVEFEKEIAGKELTSGIIKWINELKHWSLENHYFIGHIKSYIEDGNNFKLWIATTGKDINANGGDGYNSAIQKVTISITVIIYGPKIEALRMITLDILQKNLQFLNI